MRRLVIMDEEYWEALRRMAPDYGYTTRNALIVAILKQVVDGLPQYLEAGAEDAKVRYVAREMEKPWKPPLQPVSEEDIKEIFGDELDAVLTQQSEAPAPELPDL